MCIWPFHLSNLDLLCSYWTKHHQLLFSDKHPQHPSWKPLTPPNILLPFTCFASWRTLWNINTSSLQALAVNKGVGDKCPISPCLSRRAQTASSVNPAKVWGWVQNFLQQQPFPPWHWLCQVVLTLEKMNSKILQGGFQDAISFSTLEGVWAKDLD